MAALAYLIFFLPLLTDAKKDPFVRYHVRQGLGLLAAFITLRFLTLIVIAPLFYILTPLFLAVQYASNLFLAVLLALGVLNAANGREKPLPVVGIWADRLFKI